ncbi:MAG: glycosyl hydrolase family 18 protein [Leptospiraceae bacterium]|nr:glycosyl hydrolase family 18 protein [Leptospiraceae bacterium]
MSFLSLNQTRLSKILLYILLVFFAPIGIPSEEKKPTTDADKKPKTEKKELKPGKKWGYVYSNSFEKFHPDYITRIQREYDVLCVTGLLLRGNGQIRFINELMNKLQKAGINHKKNKPIVYPMISLSTVKDGVNFFSNDSARQKSIENINNFLKEHEFTGIHLDFEGLPQEFAKPLAAYLKSLKEELNKNGFKLSFALFPQIDFGDERLFHKPDLIAKAVDEIVLMAYDYHNTKTPAGCVSNDVWAKKNLEEILKHFKPDQIWLGIPAYGYEWFVGSKRVSVLSARDGYELIRLFPFSREEKGCLKISRKEKNKESFIYFADSELRASLDEQRNEFGLLGTAIWRLGMEED